MLSWSLVGYYGDMKSQSCFASSYKGGDWIDAVGEGNWEFRVKGGLSIRADTHSINNSPVSGTRPIVKLKRGCSMRIPGM